MCSCLENPRDGGAWWAAIHWVAQSLTRLKRLSSSRSKLVSIGRLYLWTSLIIQLVKNLPAMCETLAGFLGWED